MLSASSGVIHLGRYTNGIPLPFYHDTSHFESSPGSSHECRKAPSELLHFWSTQHGSHSFTCQQHHTCLYRVVRGVSHDWINSYSTSWWSILLIYRPREDERLSWTCWLTYWAVYPPVGCYCLHQHPPSPFVIRPTHQPKSWYSFHCPTEGRRLSRPRHTRCEKLA